MLTKLLVKNSRNLTLQEINNSIAAIFSDCYRSHIMVYGFYYDPDNGIYAFAPRDELEKLSTKGIKEFDVENYFIETNTCVWLVHWENPKNPEIRLYVPPQQK